MTYLCVPYKNNTIIDNDLSSGYWHIKLDNSWYNNISNNIMSDAGDYNYEASAAVYFSSSSNNIISGNIICHNNGSGVLMRDDISSSPYSKCRYNVIIDNNISDNGCGIYAQNSDSNTINYNDICTNNVSGIILSNSNGNRIYRNNILNNSWGQNNYDSSGIVIYGIKNEILRNQFIGNKRYAINIPDDTSKYNMINYNVFIENNGAALIYNTSHIQAYDETFNCWNTSTGGNYWSDWTTPDTNHDGLVDNPYFLDGKTNARDYYPLVSPVEIFDNIPPTVKILSPTNGSTVSGPVNITVNVTDNVGVVNVEFYINSVLIISNFPLPVFYWQPAVNGVYTLTFKAYDPVGNSGSDSVTVIVNNASMNDTIPPTVKINSPSNGSIVSGIITIFATATDNVGVTNVSFYVDDSLIYTDTSTPYSTSWNTYAVSDGVHTLTAKAYDAKSNCGPSENVWVNVNNGGLNDTLNHVIITPSYANLLIGNSLALTAQAYDVKNQSLPSVYNWTASPVSMGTLNSTHGQLVLFTAKSPGTCYLTVIATYVNISKNATAIINITSAILGTAILFGNVTDYDGNPISRAEVIFNATDNYSVGGGGTTTNRTGGYIFKNVPMNTTCTILVTAQGYESYKSSPFFISTNKTMKYDVKLKRVGGTNTFPAITLIAGILLVVAIVALLLVYIPTLYTRLRREQVLDHFVRGQVYDRIRKKPGMHYNELKSGLKISSGALTYHLRTLELQGFIKSRREGIFKRFYDINVPPSAEGIRYSNLQLKIIEKVKKQPGLCKSDLARELNVPPSVISYNIRILINLNALRVEKASGRRLQCYPKEEKDSKAS